MSFKPDITVAALIERAGRFLVVEERIQRRLVLNQPAGHVEERETPLAAVVRETREETAWLFHPEYLLGVYLWQHPGTARTTLRFAFAGSVSDHRPDLPLDRGIERTHWLTRDELVLDCARLRSPLVLRCVDDYLDGRRLPLDAVACLGLEPAARSGLMSFDDLGTRPTEIAG